jgi:UDP-N-acetylmuramate dehydrogenase
VKFNKTDCAFGYRDSVFKNQVRDHFLIASVTLRLSRNPKFNISYGAIRETLEKMGVKDLSIRAISDAVISIRKSKLPDPEVIGNAGSFFKNPEIEKDLFEKIKNDFPAIPHYPAPDNLVKIPAGWMIEQCGWKGKVVGNTGAHKDQALVLVNYGNASGKEILDLSQKIRESVNQKFGIQLHSEVNII